MYLYKSMMFFKGLGGVVLSIGGMVKKTLVSMPRDSDNTFETSESPVKNIVKSGYENTTPSFLQ